MNESQMEREDLERDEAAKRGAEHEEKVKEYEAHAWTDEGIMFDIFGDLNQRENFVEDFCLIKKMAGYNVAARYIDGCLREEVRAYAERHCDD